jgi:hypothetical protein
LIDNKIVQDLNVSMDGSSKETLEAIRVNVNYEKLIQNILFLISYARSAQFDFTLSFSFVLMRSNYHEFPELVKLIGRLRDSEFSKWSNMNPFRGLKQNRRFPRIVIYCQGLENYETPAYSEFIKKEHHSLVEREELIKTFQRVLKASVKTSIPVSAFYSHPLIKFIRQGYPFPPFPS